MMTTKMIGIGLWIGDEGASPSEETVRKLFVLGAHGSAPRAGRAHAASCYEHGGQTPNRRGFAV